MLHIFLIITIFKKESYEKPDDFFDEEDDDDDYFDGYGNDPDVITYIELEMQNTQYKKAKQHVLSLNLQTIQADELKETCKNQIIHTKLHH